MMMTTHKKIVDAKTGITHATALSSNAVDKLLHVAKSLKRNHNDFAVQPVSREEYADFNGLKHPSLW